MTFNYFTLCVLFIINQMDCTYISFLVKIFYYFDISNFIFMSSTNIAITVPISLLSYSFCDEIIVYRDWSNLTGLAESTYENNQLLPQAPPS